MDVEKSCLNCKHFVRHYFKNYTSIHALDCGHCMNSLKYINLNKKSTCAEKCKKWKENSSVKTEQQEEIEKTLRKISKYLKDISAILKAENE